MEFRALALLTFVAVAAATRQGPNIALLRPARPQVEEKPFFSKDYPADSPRKSVDHGFEVGSYPHIQDSSEFGKDFVKDENGDNGEWKAQSEYDRLRAKMMREQQDVAAAREKVAEEEKAMRHLNREAVAAAKRAADAAAKAKEEKAKVGDVAEEEKEEASRADSAKEALAKAQLNFEGCKQRLEEAQAAMKLAQENDADQGRKRSDGQAKARTRADEAQKAAAAAEAESANSDTKLRHVSKARGRHQDATAAYERELSDVERAKDELAKAARELCKYRKGSEAQCMEAQAKEDKEDEKSGAIAATTAPVLLIALLVAVTGVGA